MTIRKTMAALVAALFLVSCQTVQDNPKQSIGTVLGAGLGALAGAQFGKGDGNIAAIAVGAILGGLAGNQVGAGLDEADRRAMASTTHTALNSSPPGVATAWHNPSSGNSGSVKPLAFEKSAATGGVCRDFETTVNVDGKTETALGRACRQADGTWKIVK